MGAVARKCLLPWLLSVPRDGYWPPRDNRASTTRASNSGRDASAKLSDHIHANADTHNADGVSVTSNGERSVKRIHIRGIGGIPVGSTQGFMQINTEAGNRAEYTSKTEKAKDGRNHRED